MNGELHSRKRKLNIFPQTQFEFGESARYWNAEFNNTWQTIQTKVDVSTRAGDPRPQHSKK